MQICPKVVVKIFTIAKSLIIKVLLGDRRNVKQVTPEGHTVRQDR